MRNIWKYLFMHLQFYSGTLFIQRIIIKYLLGGLQILPSIMESQEFEHNISCVFSFLRHSSLSIVQNMLRDIMGVFTVPEIRDSRNLAKPIGCSHAA